MLTKLFNAAALVKDIVLDTARAPYDAYSVFKKANLNMFAKMANKKVEDSSRMDKLLASAGAVGMSGTFTFGLTTLSWVGLASVGVASLPVIGVAGVCSGFVGAGLLGRLGNKEDNPVYANTIKSYKELVS